MRPFVKNYLYNNISFVYDVTVNYVEAHEECMELIHQIVHNEEILTELKSEVCRELKIAEKVIYNDLEENFPEVIKAVQHKRGGYYLINAMRSFVNAMIQHGQIDFKEAKFFLHRLNKENRNLQLNKLKIKFEEADTDFQSHCELAKMFSKDELDELFSTFKEHTYASGDIIIKKEELLKNMYYISKGVVHEKNGPLADDDAPKMKNRAGDIIGLQFITTDQGFSFTNCYAKTVCTCRSIPISAFRKIIKSESQQDRIWGYIGPSIIHLNPDMFARLQELDAIQIKVLMKNSEYKTFQKESVFAIPNGAILFEGVLEEHSEQDRQENIGDSILSDSEKNFGKKRRVKIKSYAFVYPNDSEYIAKTDICMYMLPESLKNSWLSFNPQLFQDAFSILPGAQRSVNQGTLNNATMMKRQKTLLLGLPKGLAHKDPIATFSAQRGRRTNIGESSYGIPEGLKNKLGEGTIMPRGYTKPITALANVKPSDTVQRKVSNLNIQEEEHKNKKKVQLEDSSSETSKDNEDSQSDIKSNINSIKPSDVKLKISAPKNDSVFDSVSKQMDEEEEESSQKDENSSGSSSSSSSGESS